MQIIEMYANYKRRDGEKALEMEMSQNLIRFTMLWHINIEIHMENSGACEKEKEECLA